MDSEPFRLVALVHRSADALARSIAVGCHCPCCSTQRFSLVAELTADTERLTRAGGVGATPEEPTDPPGVTTWASSC